MVSRVITDPPPVSRSTFAFWGFQLGDTRSFSALTSKFPPLDLMLNFDADVKKYDRASPNVKTASRIHRAPSLSLRGCDNGNLLCSELSVQVKWSLMYGVIVGGVKFGDG